MRTIKSISPTCAQLVISLSTMMLVAVLISLAQAQLSKHDFVSVTNDLNASSKPRFDSRPAQSAVASCARENLTIKEGEGDQAMGGRISTPFVITNVSSSPCVLNGYPSVELLNQAGTVVKQATKDADPPPQPVTIEPGKTAWIELHYMAYGRNFKPCFTTSRIRITLPGITRPFVLRSDVSTCAKNEFRVTAIQAGAPQ